MIIASLVGTPAPTAVLAGALSIALFAIVGLIVGPNFDGINAPAIGSSPTKKDDWSKNINKLNFKWLHKKYLKFIDSVYFDVFLVT